MGVHDLWSILGPVRESVPLYSLTGKTLAVDLSLWVCEAQHVQGMIGKVTKPHLRNLFFRVSSLTLMGVKLVFVMEGEAPKIKAETMNQRTEMRFSKKEGVPKTRTTKSTNRGRFNAVLRECAEMLDCLGVPWVRAVGEAEAMCAYLDSQGLVDGCITNDGDAFLYGAQTVYRNFNLNTRDPQVDCYKTSRVRTELHLERETLVGLAILLGCDYIPKGIPGVGKEQALKLIQTLKGQTLLQRFSRWREEGVGVSERVGKKKVSHCNVCHHPGSAKAHERAGCVLCGSKHFCEPQDYDYLCPCDWHRYEQTHQASSVEASIRKKTLANDQFPFTEIINEFMVDKDRPVHNFKRRKPNILSMQNFAYDKMEWPKHYTSEKVLVLMTYTELMNRKHGRETSSQIKPLRIWKPRVRNAVACYEVIWSKPDHYVFPEEQLAESQEEVRTVEEEALFRQAYPEVVELYLREKALAQENKTKKKKLTSKKEKPVDPCDGVSDLLSQMSLKSSSADTGTQQPTTKTPKALIADHRQPETVPEPAASSGHRMSPGEAGTRTPKKEVVHPPSPPCLETSASPSVSMVMEMLHLSDIDWEAPSFTSSPPTPAGARTADPEPVRTSGYSVEERGKDTKLVSSADLRPAGLTASKPSLSDCSLRDRLLLRNTLESVKRSEVLNDNVTKCVNSCESNPVNSISSHSQGVNHQVGGNIAPLVDKGRSADSKPGSMPAIQTQKHATQAQKPSTHTLKPSSHTLKPSTHTLKPSTHTLKPSTHTLKPSTHTLKPSTHTLKLQIHTQSPPAPQTQTAKENGAGEPEPQHKYTFVKTAISSTFAPPRRHTEPVEDDGNRKLHLTAKKSVCTSVCSSSEDSDLENRHRGKQKRAKAKPKSKPHYSLKPISKPSTTKAPLDTAQPLRPKAFSASVGAQILGSFVPDKVKHQDVAPLPPVTIVDDDLFILTPGSPVTISDSDDSVFCSESPQPLAERLRLKFMK